MFNPMNLSEKELTELNKFDLHCHSMYSRDGITRPRNIIKHAKQKGLAGIAVTDHENCKAWEEANYHGKKEGVQVIQGEERLVLKNGVRKGELLALFLQEPLKANDVFGVIDEVHEQDALLIVPHPFDFLRKALKCLDEVVGKSDGIEAINGHSYFNKFNEKAFSFAEEKKLAMTAGSDAHVPAEIGKAVTLIEGSSLEELRKAILSRKTRVFGGIVPLYHHAFTQLAKLNFIKDGEE